MAPPNLSRMPPGSVARPKQHTKVALASLPTNQNKNENTAFKKSQKPQTPPEIEKLTLENEPVELHWKQTTVVKLMAPTLLQPAPLYPPTYHYNIHDGGGIARKITTSSTASDESEEFLRSVVTPICIEPLDKNAASLAHPAAGLPFVPNAEGRRLSVTLPGDSMAWVAIEDRNIVVSMIRKSFYDLYVIDKVFPWVGDHFNVKYTKKSLVPMSPGSSIPGLAEAGIAVYGMVPIAVCLTPGHPTFVKCLVVDQIFPQYTRESSEGCIEMVIGADYFVNTHIGTASLPKSPTWRIRDITPRKPASIRYAAGNIVVDICEHVVLPFGQSFDPTEREIRKKSVGKSHNPHPHISQAQRAEIQRKADELVARLYSEGREGEGASAHQGMSIAFAYQSCLNRSIDLSTAGKLFTFIACSAGTSYCHELAYYVHDRRDLVCAGLAIYFALRLRSKNGYYFEGIKINTTSRRLAEDMLKNVNSWEKNDYCLPDGNPIEGRAMYAFLQEYARLENVFVYYHEVGKSQECQKVACYLATEANELALDGPVFQTDMGDLTERDKLKQNKHPILSRYGTKAIVIENGGCQILDAPLGFKFQSIQIQTPICEEGKKHLRWIAEELRKPTSVATWRQASREAPMEQERASGVPVLVN